MLVFAEARGIHSHDALRVEYDAERIAKAGSTPHRSVGETGRGGPPPSSTGQRGRARGGEAGHAEAIGIASDSGAAVVGIRKMSHSGALSYFPDLTAAAGMVGLSVCQCDPMVVPYGGAESYYGTNPIDFTVTARSVRYVVPRAASVSPVQPF